MSVKQKIRIAKARSFVKIMDRGEWLSDKGMQFTMQVADAYGDDALWQQQERESEVSEMKETTYILDGRLVF